MEKTGNQVSCLTGTRTDIINKIKEWADQMTVTSFELSSSIVIY